MKCHEEMTYHKKYLQEAYDLLREKFPDFKFQAFIMDLTGKIEEVQIVKKEAIEHSNESNGDGFLSSIRSKFN